MPHLPKADTKIVVRPRGGLNLAKVGGPAVTTTIFHATCIAREERALDTICTNKHQNIIVISTPNEANIDKPANATEKVSWADVVNGSPKRGVSGHSTPKRNNTSYNNTTELEHEAIAELRRENATLRHLVQQLTKEVQDLKKEHGQPLERPVNAPVADLPKSTTNWPRRNGQYSHSRKAAG
ncbi:hypothetical protein HPB49_015174 [Dermacentor silvarum]|uniref:Uncharacterized protein n=1 Tax=Dermacentor silvarum TaxID=543639 RepID=A0ACB8CFZ3_DERSI|nr:hypothetical protein HPB49_015174 [Dermacentor silvarum]